MGLHGVQPPKGVFKGGGVQTPPKFSDFFLKSEGKEVERKRKKMRRDGRNNYNC